MIKVRCELLVSENGQMYMIAPEVVSDGVLEVAGEGQTVIAVGEAPPRLQQLIEDAARGAL